MKEKIWIETDDELEPCKAYWHYYHHGQYKTKPLADLTPIQIIELKWNLGCIRTVMRKVNSKPVFVKIISPEVFDEIITRKKTLKDRRQHEKQQ